MTTPASPNSISLGQVNTELTYSATAAISMNDAAVRALAGVGGSGVSYNMDNLRSKTYIPPTTSYTLTFDSNGVSGTAYTQTAAGTAALTANTYTYATHSFAGWATAATTDVVYADQANYTFAAAATIYARWNSTVTTYPNGGVGSTAYQTAYKSTILTTNSFYRTNYTFAGWASNSAGAVTYVDNAAYSFIFNASFYARWNSTVTFAANGGTGSLASQTAYTDTSLRINAAISRTNYTFAGWSTNTTGTIQYANGASYPFSAGATTLNAIWNSTVNFATNGGTGSLAAQTACVATALTTNSSNIVRTNYTFAGWSTSTGAVQYANGASYPFTGGNVALNAIWNSAVTFNGNGNTSGSTAAQTACVATALTANGFVKTSNSFNGWNTVVGGTGTAYANNASYPFTAGAVTLYAQWTSGGGVSVTFAWVGAPASSINIAGTLYGGTGSVVVTGTTAGIHVYGANGQVGGGPGIDWYYYGYGGNGGAGGNYAANFTLVSGETYNIRVGETPAYADGGGGGGGYTYVEASASKYIAGAGGGGGGEASFDDGGTEMEGWGGSAGISYRAATGGSGGAGSNNTGTVDGGDGYPGGTALVGGTMITLIPGYPVRINIS